MRATQRVAIGLCTAHRPEMLRCCLAALASQIVPEALDLTIIVADNEPEPNNQHLVSEFAASCSFPVRYVHEPRRGISRARNAVLDACEDRFDWIAFTDDDCVPASDWIGALLEAAARHEADLVYGRREWTPPRRPPFWFVPEKPTRRDEGQRLQVAATHNVLMAGELAGLRFRERHAGLRFDERLAHGEDTDFFWRATTRFGARIVYSAAPVVYETVPAHPATMRYQMMRRFHRDASRYCFERRYRMLAAQRSNVQGASCGTSRSASAYWSQHPCCHRSVSIGSRGSWSPTRAGSSARLALWRGSPATAATPTAR